MKHILSILAFILVFSSSFSQKEKKEKKPSGPKDDGKIEIVFIQVNDVYEISPVAGGKEGGMARVATLKKQYQANNPNTFLVMAGDFVSPSVYNSMEYGGKKIKGTQMIDAMNAAGTDIACFGNHEFDLKEDELQERINESGFVWVASNVMHKYGDTIEPFKRNSIRSIPSFPETLIMTVADRNGTKAKIGFIGLTIPSNPAEYVSYKDPLATAIQCYNKIKDSVDAVVAITHQALEDDIKLALQLPKLALIMGGHEHGMEFEKIGKVYITKAHANARSAFVIKMDINKKNKKVEVEPVLKKMDESVPIDSGANFIVQKWAKIAAESYSTLGFNANRIVIAEGDVLDGRETETRTSATGLTRMIGRAMAYACDSADLCIFNSGSIRLDDVLVPPVSEYDIIRTLPFGGGIREVLMRGSLLIRILDAGRRNRGSGGFLQTMPTMYDAGSSFLLNNSPIGSHKTYRVALTDFLLSGREVNLAFLNESNKDIIKVFPAATSKNDPKIDIRLAVINFLDNL